MTPEILYLTARDVADLASDPTALADAVIEAMRRARGDANPESETTSWPKRIEGGPDGLRFITTGGRIEGVGGGFKWLSESQARKASGLTALMGIFILFDDVSGAPVALISAEALTVARTAAVSLAAARYLARRDARVLGLVGAGRQARAHVEALRLAFPIEVVRIHSSQASAEALRRDLAETGVPAEIVPADHLVETSDILVSTVPQAPGLRPFLDARRLAPGSLAVMVDLGRSWLSDSLRALPAVFTDEVAASRQRALSEPHMAGIDYAGDLADLRQGQTNGRQDPVQAFAFLFGGTGLADVAVGDAIYREALRQGVGVRLPL